MIFGFWLRFLYIYFTDIIIFANSLNSCIFSFSEPKIYAIYEDPAKNNDSKKTTPDYTLSLMSFLAAMILFWYSVSVYISVSAQNLTPEIFLKNEKILPYLRLYG